MPPHEDYAETLMMSRNTQIVGKRVDKIDSLGLATGRAYFTDDIYIHDMLHARLLTSPIAHARIRRLDTASAECVPGVVHILTHENVPHIPYTTAGQGFPEPSPYDTILLDLKVRYIGDIVAVVAAETEEAAQEGIRKINVEYEPLPAVFDPEAALAPGAPIIHDEEYAKAVIPVPYHPECNMAADVYFSVGPVEQIWDESSLQFDHAYSIHRASHCAIERHTVIAYLDPDGRLIIRSSTQVPFHARRIVAHVLEEPVHRIRVIKPRIGGGFGGKQEIILEPLAGLISLRTERPVRLGMTRNEVFTTSRTRHPQRLRLRSVVDPGGVVSMLDLDTVLDTGANGSHALTVATNTGSKVLPLVNKVKAVRFRARTAYTNLPPSGAYRGYGATQGAFPLNVQMDIMADALKIDVLDLWRKNRIQTGESSPVFEALGEGTEGVSMEIRSCGLDTCISRGAEAIGWKSKRRKPSDDRFARGVGMAALMQGSSIPRIDMAAASLKLNDDGSVNLLVGATDLGTGSDTILAQIAAESLTIPLRKVVVYSSDTDITPFDTGAYASSTTYLSGEAVRRASEDLSRNLKRVAAEMINEPIAALRLEDGCVAGNERSVSFSEIALRSLYQESQEQLCGNASAYSEQSPPPFAAHFAEVEVDRETGVITVISYVAAVDCGVAINPSLAEGQTEGAVINGIGYALFEEYLMDPNGRMRNDSFVGYRIPSIRDLPAMKTILVPTYEPTGPYGAKSISEISINGPVPAISNAVFDATGVRLYHAPFTADRVWKALSAT